MNKEEIEKVLLGKCLNGFTIKKVEYDPFIKNQINLITDGFKIVPPCNDRDTVIFRLRNENTFGASWYEQLQRIEHQALFDIKDKLLCYGETFDNKIHQEMQKELLDIVNKALKDGDNNE